MKQFLLALTGTVCLLSPITGIAMSGGRMPVPKPKPEPVFPPDPERDRVLRDELNRAVGWLLSEVQPGQYWEFDPPGTNPPCPARGNAGWNRAIDSLVLDALAESVPHLEPEMRRRVMNLLGSADPPDRDWRELAHAESAWNLHRRAKDVDPGPAFRWAGWEAVLLLDLSLSLLDLGLRNQGDVEELSTQIGEYLYAQSHNEWISYGDEERSDRSSNTVLTGVCLLVLGEARARGIGTREEVYDAAVGSLRNAHNPNSRTWPYRAFYRGQPQHYEAESAGRSVLCALALTHHHSSKWEKENLLDMVERFVNLFGEIEDSWGKEKRDALTGTAGYYIHFGAYYTAAAAHHLGDRKAYRLLRKIVDRIRGTRQSGGSFSDGTCHRPYYQTAYAVRTLALELDAAAKASE